MRFLLEAAGAIEGFRAGAGYDLICILGILFVERVEATRLLEPPPRTHCYLTIATPQVLAGDLTGL